ncbi:MAG TPA: hypothetical protein PLY05_10855 [Agitococcus sp.]|nr:hypothetical protein [Agitococcus sp.]
MTEALNPEVFSLASQLYVRMRRCSGRVVDAVYMAKNEQYAQEILQIAAQEKDQEILDIVKRFEAILAKKSVDLKATMIPELPIVTDMVKESEQATEKTDIFSMTFRNLRRKVADLPTVEQLNGAALHNDHLEEEVAHHYTGALR